MTFFGLPFGIAFATLIIGLVFIGAMFSYDSEIKHRARVEAMLVAIGLILLHIWYKLP